MVSAVTVVPELCGLHSGLIGWGFTLLQHRAQSVGSEYLVLFSSTQVILVVCVCVGGVDRLVKVWC